MDVQPHPHLLQPAHSSRLKKCFAAHIKAIFGGEIVEQFMHQRPNIRVLKSATGREYSKEGPAGFAGLFRDRFEKISRILCKGPFTTREPELLRDLCGMTDGSRVAVVGMVADKRKSAAGNTVIELDDPSGAATAIVFNRGEVFKKADRVVLDEVIGVVGSVRTGDSFSGTPRIFVEDLVWPDLPAGRELNFSSTPSAAALVSDLHIGSEKFLEDLFLKFIKWLRGEGDNQELAKKVKYLIIAGDVVDGIGVYPQQLDELLLTDVHKQYEAAAKLLGQVPEHITIIIAPGNHDAVRALEPQPPIPEDAAPDLYNLPNVVMVGNPALISLGGVRFLVYHGKSFDNLAGTVPGLSYQAPAQMMVELLKKRHLSPIYGGKAAVFPAGQDSLVIDEIPDVFHCGHAHVYDCADYRGVLAVNSGTFQAPTTYTQSHGIRPTPGHVPVINLMSHGLEVQNFA
jgi:DNA polymerase II small subunit